MRNVRKLMSNESDWGYHKQPIKLLLVKAQLGLNLLDRVALRIKQRFVANYKGYLKLQNYVVD